MNESDVELIVKEYVEKTYNSEKGWIVPVIHRGLKGKGEHGVDISLYNQKKGDRLVIEVKKWSKVNAANHNAFYSIFGQLLSRIKDIPSDIYSKRRKMVIAAPIKFIEMIHKKIHSVKNNRVKGMQGGWTLFGRMSNLRIWSVNMKTKEIKEYHWKDFLKNKLK